MSRAIADSSATRHVTSNRSAARSLSSGASIRNEERGPMGVSTRDGSRIPLISALPMAAAPFRFRFPIERMTVAVRACGTRSMSHLASTPERAGKVDKPVPTATLAARACSSSSESSKMPSTHPDASAISTQWAPASTTSFTSSTRSAWKGPAVQATATQPPAACLSSPDRARSIRIGSTRPDAQGSRSRHAAFALSRSRPAMTTSAFVVCSSSAARRRPKTPYPPTIRSRGIRTICRGGRPTGRTMP
jgi:hypothetical protein